MANATVQLNHETTGGDYGAVSAPLNMAVIDTAVPTMGNIPAFDQGTLSYTYRERQRVWVQFRRRPAPSR